MNKPFKIPMPDDVVRVESGAVQFGEDWPGLYLRGDDCMRVYTVLEQIDTSNLNLITQLEIRGMIETFRHPTRK